MSKGVSVFLSVILEQPQKARVPSFALLRIGVPAASW